MHTPQTVVIAGAGLAGAKAAETLREVGFDRRIVLLGAGPERPGMNVDVWDVTSDIQALIRAGEPVEARRLADPAVALGDLLAEPVRRVA